MLITSTFILVLMVFYTFYVIKLISAIDKVRGAGDHKGRPFVSVIIAVHNEVKYIEKCLLSVLDQTYPAENFEVIVADDRSDDGTAAILYNMCASFPNLHTIRIQKVPDGVSPKKHALSRAIESAKGEIILQTDGDCIVQRHWISGMVKGFEKDVGMVVGIAPYLPAPSYLNSFIRHEYFWNAALAVGSIALGWANHASGRNLGFRKSSFKEAGGYGNSEKILSGDDTLLLHRISKTRYSIMPVTSILTHVFTRSPENFSSFIRQRIRHMSTGKYFNPFHLMLGGTVYGLHVLILAFLILSPFSTRILFVIASVFAWKMAVDSWAIRKTQEYLMLDFYGRGFFLNEILLTIYMAVIPVLGLFVPASWKEKS